MNKNKTKITAEVLHQFAKQLMFNLNDEQIKILLLEFETINSQFESITTINTTQIEPLDYPLPIINTTLRSDEIITEPLSVQSILNLAPTTEKNYITINQVINNEN